MALNLSIGDTQLLINEANRQGILRNQLAYVLATVYHETAFTMKPIKERGGLRYLKSKKYYPYFGRGYVQLTWDYNYKKAGIQEGIDFIKNPDLLLVPKYAIPICITGMREGWFTGKKLSDYMTLQKSDFENARRIINKLDAYQKIATYARQYDFLLIAAHYGMTNLL